MDVLLQRLGRLHRHNKQHQPRPTGYEEPQATVLVPTVKCLDEWIGKNGTVSNGGSLGYGSVYEDLRILQATWNLLQDEHFRPLQIPRQNRALVEAATHPDALKSLPGDWAALEIAINGKDCQHRQLATGHSCEWTSAFDLRNDFTDGDLLKFDQIDRKITTRLGLEDRLIVLPPDTEGPFGQPVRQLKLPGHWFERKKFPDQDFADSIDVSQGKLTLRVGEWLLSYDHKGLCVQ